MSENGPRRWSVIAVIHGIDVAHRRLASLFFDHCAMSPGARDRAVEGQAARQVRCRRRRKLGINVNAITQRIVVFLRDVDLRVSLNAAQHGKAEKPQLLI